jgi:hypothetical protein
VLIIVPHILSYLRFVAIASAAPKSLILFNLIKAIADIPPRLFMISIDCEICSSLFASIRMPS